MALALLVLVAVSAVALGHATPARAAAPTFHVAAFGPRFQEPVWIGSPRGSSRVFVVERRGVIKSIHRGRTSTFADLRSRVNDGGGEQGLLSMEFDPNYGTNRRFWVLYTNAAGNAAVRKYRSNGVRLRRGTGRNIMTIPLQPPSATNHNGGMLRIGPDKHLYISVGDGGESGDPLGNAQNRSVLMGKILRIKPRSTGGYTVPSTNPYVGRAGLRSEIWALGLRNPWRFSFDRGTGDMWIGDVGQSAEEEVDHLPAGTPGGSNFGWRRFEGSAVYDAGHALAAGTTHTAPVYTYTHSSGGCSITGGFVYRGSRVPALRGRYLFGDYCTTWIRGVTPAGSAWTRRVGVASISSFGETRGGEVLLTSLSTGRAYRIVR